MTVSRAVAASPRRKPGQELAPVDERPDAVPAPAPRRPPAARAPRCARSTRPAAASATAASSAPSATPTASSVSPTATTWARYQVEPFSAVYQKTVPNAKKIVTAIRTDGADPQPAEHPEREADVERAEDRRDALLVGREPPQLDERQQDERRQRRERQQAAAGRRRRRRR